MRSFRFDLLCAGAMLASIAAAPTSSSAAPERIRQVVPLPPSVNGQIIRRHREAAPVPPPPAPTQRSIPAPEPVAQMPVQQEPVAQVPPAPAAASASTAGLIMSTLDKLLTASDAQIAEKLRETVTAKSFGKGIQHADERKAIENFYAKRQYAPLWIHDGRLTVQAKATVARLKDAAAEGLDASDYPVPEFGNDAGALADGDIKLTQSALTFSRHLAVGRISPTRVSAEVDHGDHTPEPADILKKLSEARDVNATFDGFDPPQAGFKALKAKLAELRSGEARAEASDRIPAGPTIKLGAKDTRVPLLRERLNVNFAPRPETVRVRDKRTGRVRLIKLPKRDDPAAELVYDKVLFKAIKHIQARADIKPTGAIDKRTLAAINGPSHAQKIELVAANMERWRWLPRDLGNTYVMVNIPDYSLKVMRNGRQVWTTKIVAGKPQTPTPLLTATMDNVIVNPSWYVPQSIIQNEYLPLYESDPNIFDRLGLEVRRGSDGHINVVQPPGAANALGRIKFNFPNKFHVYLHDTPEKRLFSASRRAFSHGCMRVEDPTKFGEIMLQLAMSQPMPNSRQIQSLFGQDERIFRLERRPRVHLTYQTAFVDDAGKLELRDDIYGFDARIHSILNSAERRVADVAPPKDPKRDLATLRSNQEILRRVERREANNPFIFFERLFR
ncbi:MAG: L,D-transpeptidase family protein [Pseudolabrys sp.]|nr:L,D-transpeptidase family protein [Pseudolabrys sp.]